MKKNKSYVIVEAPIFEGGVSRGPELAYSFFKKNCSKKICGEFYDYVERVKPSVIDSDSNIKNIQQVLSKCENVRLNILDAFSRGLLPVVLGGDHSVAMASIAAVSETFGMDNIATIYIDGHCDINTEVTSPTHNIHGMPLASSLGLCSKALQVGQLNKKILGGNIFILGARSIDSQEYDIIKNNNVHLYESKSFTNIECLNILFAIKKMIGNKKVHVSFDVDVIDPKDFSSTGYLMDHGLSKNYIISMLDKILSLFDVVSIDIVEYNPLLDKNKKDLKTILSIFKLVEKHIN